MDDLHRSRAELDFAIQLFKFKPRLRLISIKRILGVRRYAAGVCAAKVSPHRLAFYNRPKLRRLAKLFFPIISESCSAIFITLSARSTCWLKVTSAFDGVGSPEGWL